jgi:hypothetical protein
MMVELAGVIDGKVVNVGCRLVEEGLAVQDFPDLD